MNQITCQNLAIGYDGRALHENINFEIPKGAYVSIVGENGAGKSTLMKTLLGLIAPISGKYALGEGLKPSDIGYLPQQTQIQKDFPASVFEVVLSGCLNQQGWRPFYNKAEKAKARERLENLGISHLERKSYSKLSGGQQQRVLLARALCATNKILLLDEPTSSLDSASTAEMYRTIKQLNDDGITILSITHSLEQVLSDTEYILEVKNNSVDFVTKAEYLENNAEKTCENNCKNNFEHSYKNSSENNSETNNLNSGKGGEN